MTAHNPAGYNQMNLRSDAGKGRGGLRKNWERRDDPELSPRMEAILALVERPHQEEVARHPGAWDILRLPKHREGER